MERHYNNEFEGFLKQNADQYRLYPSAKPWKGIYAHFHGKRRWFGLGAILLLVTGSLLTVITINSAKEPVASNVKPSSNSTTENHFTPVVSTPSAELKTNSFAHKQVAINNTRTANQIANTNVGVNGIQQTETAAATEQPIVLTPIFIILNDEMTDQDLYNQNTDQKNKTANESLSINNLDKFNQTIESVLNSYNRKKKIGFEFNFTPTVSYRKLSVNESYVNSVNAQPSVSYAPLYNINSAVTHKPDMGLEMGLTAKYSVNSNFRVIAGLQFNVNRYDIKAFDYPIEVATIALNSGSKIDSFYTISTHRNFNGNNPNWLQNLYFQVSMPVGIELLMAGDDKMQFGLAGSIQPTYILSDRAYLLTTDYKNYAEVPWLIRHWNANTAFQTFVAYSTGKVKWQVGPQVRYQLFSSFVKKYPVKENLFDFGLKIGMSLNTP